MHDKNLFPREASGSEVKLTRKTRISVRMEKALYEKIKSEAEKECSSVSDWFYKAIQQKLKRNI